MGRLVALAVCSSLLVLTLGSGAGGAARDVSSDTGLFLNILPPGQGSSLTLRSGNPPPHSDDQLGMYSSLIAAGDLSDADLNRYFKSESFTLSPEEVEREEHPAPGVTILRDAFGVPHIYGESRPAAMFGAGYATGEDRLFMADVLRHVGRGRLSEFLGPSKENLDMDRSVYLVAGYSEAELEQQIARLAEFGELGLQVIADGEAFIDGMNARIEDVLKDPTQLPVEYPALQVTPKRWKPTDLVAVATLIQAIFASGGGGELANAQFLQEARAKLGRRRAVRLFADLRTQEDKEAPVTADGSFPYMSPGPVDPAAVAIPDRGSVFSYDPISTAPGEPGSSWSGARAAGPRGPGVDPYANLADRLLRVGMAFPRGASNWLAVTADRTASHHPIAVMGPQTGYWSPEILMEMDIHAPRTDRGPGLDARGATFPGISLYVLLGRGTDYAWSATSGSSDLTDVRAERLCEPDGGNPGLDSIHYVHKGSCVRMLVRQDKWLSKPSPGGPGPPTEVTATVQRTVHGPVFARGRVRGRPVALVQQRSTFFGELDSALPFAPLNSGMVTDARSFQRTMAMLTGSFNWLYVDDRDVAYFHSGLYPVRARGVDPDFPSWGTGRWEWRGFLPFSRHPRQINSPRGWIDSWNNKPAAGWRAADNKWDYGSVHRAEMLSDRLARRIPRGNVTPSDVVEIMAAAATVDLRGQEVLPPVLRLIGDAPGLRRYVRILKAWVATGAHRLDRDGNGRYDDQAAVALMDQWWERLIHGAFDGTLRGLYGSIPLIFDDHPGPVGSAFLSGWYGYVEKSVRMAGGHRVPGGYRVLRCADGTRAGCRAALIRSLQGAIQKLGRDPSAWEACESCDAIHFTSIGLVSVPDIPWQNRPTFQQVVQVRAHRPR